MKGITIKVNEYNIDKDKLITDLKNIANKINSNTLSRKEYKENGGKYSEAPFKRCFGSWNNALKEAGFEVNTNNIAYSELELYNNYINVCEKLGKQASSKDMRNAISEIAESTYSNRFGSWNNFLIKFIDYLDNGELSVEIKTRKKRNIHSIPLSLRYKILVRDNFSCKRCGQSPAKNKDIILQIDHIIPFSKGGETVEENLEVKCSDCNYGKSNNYNI